MYIQKHSFFISSIRMSAKKMKKLVKLDDIMLTQVKWKGKAMLIVISYSLIE